MQQNKEPQPRQVSGRKLSIPSLKIPQNTGLFGQANLVNVKRRFSHVGLVVPRRLSVSAVIHKQAPSQDIINTGRALTALHLRSRLRRAGLFSKKPGLGAGAATVASTVREVYPSLACATAELERMHPRVFSNIVRQVGGRYSEENTDVDEAAIFTAISQQVLNSETWGSVIAVFSVAGSLTIEAARHGRSEELSNILDAMSELLEERLGLWVSQHGGWQALTKRCRLRRTQSRITLPIEWSMPYLTPPFLFFIAVGVTVFIVAVFSSLFR